MGLALPGFSGTTVKISSEEAADAPAIQKKRSCQEMKVSRCSTGVVAISAPSPPMPSRQPLTSGQRFWGNHSVIALNEPIRPAAQPRPISARPTISVSGFVPRPKITAPAPAISSSTVCTRRGP
ncbi:MAG: hypothetical protein TEF_13630 [Rhizobiales bacterium NRL2]|nr:MAG: hypothetical protein TEF_13630 [Rhizobiales bacterium NRL2]